MTTMLHATPAKPLPTPLDPPRGDLSDIELLHSISTELIGVNDSTVLYGKIVEAAVTIAGSQFGTMQRLCPMGDPSGHGGQLQLLSHRGLPPEAVGFWQWVSPAAYSSCTMALKVGQRAIIPDFETWEDIAGTDDLTAFRKAGIRSAQTTPLLSRTGVLLGMISTHWSDPHEPTERDLRLLDILARQAADLLERTIADEALRAREQDLEQTCATLRETENALRDLNETLERRVDERSAQLTATEDQVRQMQKMEAIGQLTGGVAHDFNNLLTIIRSSADLLRRQDLEPSKRKRYVDAISDTADRAAKLTGQLLAFARRQALRPELFDANDRVASIADMLRTVVGSRIELTLDPVGEACVIEADASQFETALINMVVNARDAMDGEGRLGIRVKAARGVPAVRGHAAVDGRFVMVSISDTGSGMPADQLDRIFEPFFTTKEVGKGTGLGLSQVYGFAKQSGGDVDVASKLGHGTTFSLYLPQSDAPADPTDIFARDVAMPSACRVLVVEDNEQVGEFATQLLNDLGYRTLYAANARDAIALIEDRHDAIDILFSDVVMPGESGVDLGRKVREKWPNITVVLTSGYSHVLAEDARHGFELLHKPYSVESLSRVLRQAQQNGR